MIMLWKLRDTIEAEHYNEKKRKELETYVRICYTDENNGTKYFLEITVRNRDSHDSICKRDHR